MREQRRSVQHWGTSEELLLACAVNRHGTDRWDSIAMELLRRVSATDLTPDACRHRFDVLKRRFSLQDEENESAGLLVDRLTKIRLDELRRDLRRSDSSIVSLELKVKKMVEEREMSLKTTKTEKDSRVESSEKNLGEEEEENRKVTSKSEDDSNRSFDESNSTTQRRDDSIRRPSAVAPEKSEAKPEPNDESDRAREEEEEDNEAIVTMRESNNNNIKNISYNITNSAKQSSEVQSSAKRRRVGGEDVDEGDGGEEVSPAAGTTVRISAIKYEPLITKLLGMVRSHRLGSVFQRRLRSQETQRYKNMVRQHIDLRTIEARLDKGVYYSSSDGLNKFFRDLLLLFTNGVVFFRLGSQEHVAAKELRSLVVKEMNKNDDMIGKRPKTATVASISTPTKSEVVIPKKEVENSNVPKPKNKSSSIIVTCGAKRSGTTSAKPLSEVSTKKGSSDNRNITNNVSINKKGREIEEKKASANKKIVNGASFAGKKRNQEASFKRRGSKNSSNSTDQSTTISTNNEGEDDDDHSNEREFGVNELSSHDTKEAIKTTTVRTTKTKKQGVASFLKRIKQNSPKKEVDQKNDDESDDTGSGSVSEEEEEEEEKELEEKEEKKKSSGNGGKKMNKGLSGGGGPSNDQRVTRNSTKISKAAKEERDRNAKKGVGRPPKKVAGNGKRRDVVNGGDNHPRKRSRR